MPSVLFVHNGSTKRFEFIANALLARGWKCALLNGPEGRDLDGVQTALWNVTLPPKQGSAFVARAEDGFARGRAAGEAAQRLKDSGFEPDLIIGHPAWGEMVFLNEVFPDAKQIQVGELYYRTRGGETGFDPEFARHGLDRRMQIHAGNAIMAMSYAQATRIVAATPFQKSMLPEAFRERTAVIHEGIDTANVKRDPAARVRVPGGASFTREQPVITFINRFLEPLRGFHVFLRAMPRFQDLCPEAHVIIVGSDAPDGYGLKPAPGHTWKEHFLRQLEGRLDLSRIHFVGQIAYLQLQKLLSVSAAHVYYTYPFVLSWSLLDAMACECLIVGSDTAPVRDVIVPGQNGLLVDFFDTDGLAATLADAFQHQSKFEHIRLAARETVVNDYDRARKCEPEWIALIDEVLAKPGNTV